jgi:hypothetical protein
MRLNEMYPAIFRLGANYVDAGGDKSDIKIEEATEVLSGVIDAIFVLDKAKPVKIKDVLFRLQEKYNG